MASFRRVTRLVDGEVLTVQLLQETQVEDAARLLTETFARSLGYKPSQWWAVLVGNDSVCGASDHMWLGKDRLLDRPPLCIHLLGDAEPLCTESLQGRAARGDRTLSGSAPRSVSGRAAPRRSHGRAGAQRSARARCERAKHVPGTRNACRDRRGLAVRRNPSPAPDSTAAPGALGCDGWKMCCFACAVAYFPSLLRKAPQH